MNTATGAILTDRPRLVDRLNDDCFCIEVDKGALWNEIDRLSGGIVPRDEMSKLFSAAPVFVGQRDVEAMVAVVRAIERAAALPAYRERVLARAPDIARHDPGPIGAFMGYDFHLTPDGPRLIEINTNAGGAFLCALAGTAQVACCRELETAVAQPSAAEFEARVVAMFEGEWHCQGRSGRPRSLAIVDDAPTSQPLYWEFRLARALFERHGIATVIADPTTLVHRDGRLWAGEFEIDIVYDRLVDFDLSAPEHGALRAAHLAGDVVLTPGPRAHALFADKRNLVLLSDPVEMARLGLGEPDLSALRAIPSTVPVTAQNADQLWRERKSHFFKPAGGHAGKAVYRGDKMTRGVWETIVAEGRHVAQRLASPSRRNVLVEEVPTERKADIRLYTYAGDVLLIAARLYQGQTTNFRTVGGGFSLVIIIPEF